jgi:hypothetical protein
LTVITTDELQAAGRAQLWRAGGFRRLVLIGWPDTATHPHLQKLDVSDAAPASGDASTQANADAQIDDASACASVEVPTRVEAPSFAGQLDTLKRRLKLAS